jgi:hypothetical protein
VSDNLRRVKVSAASARLRFQGCDPDYIRTTCHGACCHVKSVPMGTIVRVEPDQQPGLIARGAVILEGILQTVNRRCVFIDDPAGLCTLHGTPDKPRNCIQSPFILNDHDTLIVRNRYKLLVCYQAVPALPAYVAFRASLDLIFGLLEASRVVAHLEGGGGDLMADMPAARYDFLKDVSHTWRGRPPAAR